MMAGTYDEVAIYTEIAALSDVELVREALETLAFQMKGKAEGARDPYLITLRRNSKPRVKEAVLFEGLHARLVRLAATLPAPVEQVLA